MKVAVLGLGYVGSVTAACLADAGHDVIGVDPSEPKVTAINSGETPIVEPGLAELIAKVHSQKRLTASTDLAHAGGSDVIFVSVGTPAGADGELDLSQLKAVMTQLGFLLRGSDRKSSVVIRSTVLPGTTKRIITPLLEEISNLRAGADFDVAFCPEFLRESTAIQDFHNPPFTIIGVESPSAASAIKEVLSFINAPIEQVTTGVAEAVKYASNTFHALKVGFANEISRICAATEADPRTVMALFVQDRELNISPRYLRPGFAFGGSCLPKDVKALQHFALENRVNAPIIQSLITSNDAHIDQVVNTVRNAGYSKVALIGLAFKPNTDDLRESPYVTVASRLISAGISVSAYDPIIRVSKLVGTNQAFVNSALPDLSSILFDDIHSCLAGAEAVLIGTNTADVCDAILAARPVPVIDLSGALPPSVEAALRHRKLQKADLRSYTGAAW